jgi:hypothetical protein
VASREEAPRSVPSGQLLVAHRAGNGASRARYPLAEIGNDFWSPLAALADNDCSVGNSSKRPHDRSAKDREAGQGTRRGPHVAVRAAGVE